MRWTGRVFYKRESGIEVSLSELWGGHEPGAIRSLVNLMGLLGTRRVRPALRWALADEEAAL